MTTEASHRRTTLPRIAAVIASVLIAALCAALPATAHADEIEAQETGSAQEIIAATVKMYRMYNPRTGEHLYTADAHERDVLQNRDRWDYEGVGWRAPQGGDPVYRLYNRATGEHFYTMDAHERDVLRAGIWNYEGVAFRSASGSDRQPVYRMFKPGAAHSHHYSLSANERNVCISQLGWRDEGIGWYACPAVWVEDTAAWDEVIEEPILERHISFKTFNKGSSWILDDDPEKMYTLIQDYQYGNSKLLDATVPYLILPEFWKRTIENTGEKPLWWSLMNAIETYKNHFDEFAKYWSCDRWQESRWGSKQRSTVTYDEIVRQLGPMWDDILEVMYYKNGEYMPQWSSGNEDHMLVYFGTKTTTVHHDATGRWE